VHRVLQGDTVAYLGMVYVKISVK